ncbi:MAG: sugar phosphate isomerase/epimerase family protein [Allomuricauda sp.]
MIKFSAFADEVAINFRDQIDFLATQEVPAIEIRFVNGKNIMKLTRTELNEAKSMLDATGIEVSAIGSPIGKVAIDEPFEVHLEEFEHAVELAHFFNTDLIRVFSYYPPKGKSIDHFRDEVIKRMSKKAALLAGTDMLMVHENESNIYGHSAENCVDLIEAVNSPNLKLAYDPANFVTAHSIANNVGVCWPLMKPHVRHVHIKDWKLNSAIGSLPGQGAGQIRKLIAELVKADYKGFITMEPHLNKGGQFGGRTNPDLFAQALAMVKVMCMEAGLDFTE